MPGKPWTKEETEYIKENWTKKGSACAEGLPGRTLGAVRGKAKDLGLRSESHYWTEDEEKYIRDNFNSMSVKDIAEHLGKPAQNVSFHANHMGLRKRTMTAWTVDERAVISNGAAFLKYKDLSFILGEEQSRIERWCFNHNVKRGAGCTDGMTMIRDTWSNEDLRFLYLNFRKYKDKELAERLNRKKKDVKSVRKTLGLSRKQDGSAVPAYTERKSGKYKTWHNWTFEEREFLIEHYESMTDAEMAKTLGVTECAIRGQKHRLRLNSIKTHEDNFNHSRWTEKDDKYLRKHIEDMTVSEIARNLGKTAVTVRSRIARDGLKRSSRYGKAWTEDELNIIRHNWKENGPEATQALLPGRPATSVKKKAIELGIVPPSRLGRPRKKCIIAKVSMTPML